MTPRRRLVVGIVSGAVATVLVSIGLLALSVQAALALGVGLGMGVGVGLLSAPMPPRPIRIVDVEPTTTDEVLAASTASTARMREAMHRLVSGRLWSRSTLDERLADTFAAIENLASMPKLRERGVVDGDVRMLFTIATDYLPTIVNLAIENDRMHSTFRGARSIDAVEQNVRDLEVQAGILAEAVGRIETDVAEGTSRDIQQHAAFLRSRFEDVGGGPLDLSTPLAAPHRASESTNAPRSTQGEIHD